MILLLNKIHYFASITFFILGLYTIVSAYNLFKKVAGLVVLQSGVLLFFISSGKVLKGKVPILECLNFNECPSLYTNPLPHVLMLTAIVVGFTTTSVACAIIIKIYKNFNTIEENELLKIKN
jgi:multicomponent Na+:H+ antiporter subunit C